MPLVKLLEITGSTLPPPPRASASPSGFPVAALAAQVRLHIRREWPHGDDGIAQAGFRAVEEVAPVVHLVGGLHVDAGGIGRRGHADGDTK